MAFKCVIHGRATILRESGRRTFNHSTGGKSQLCHARGGNSRTTINYCARYKAKLRQVSYGYKDGGDQTARRVPWNKILDTIEVAFPAPIVKVTKREILRKISKIYDLLGLASPVTLAGKMLYRETCDARVPWDCDLPRELKNAWESWERLPTGKVEVRRSLVEYREEILSIDPHAFGDAGSKDNSAAVYAVTHKSSGITQGLVTSKSRLAKKGLTTPRLELVAGHMATNLVDNVKEALQGFPIRSVYGWLDSSVALHWIKGGGNYKQFVGNRVSKI